MHSSGRSSQSSRYNIFSNIFLIAVTTFAGSQAN